MNLQLQRLHPEVQPLSRFDHIVRHVQKNLLQCLINILGYHAF